MSKMGRLCLFCEGVGWTGYDINGNENKCIVCSGTGEFK